MTRQKTGGRQKGTPNKTTSTTKEWISQLLDDNREPFESDLQYLEPKERLLILERLKMQSVQQDVTASNEPVSLVAFYQGERYELTATVNNNPHKTQKRVNLSCIIMIQGIYSLLCIGVL